MVTGSTTSLARFVPTAELVCNQGFEWSDLRKHSDVGRLTSCQRSYLHGLSRASVAEWHRSVPRGTLPASEPCVRLAPHTAPRSIFPPDLLAEIGLPLVGSDYTHRAYLSYTSVLLLSSFRLMEPLPHVSPLSG